VIQGEEPCGILDLGLKKVGAMEAWEGQCLAEFKQWYAACAVNAVMTGECTEFVGWMNCYISYGVLLCPRIGKDSWSTCISGAINQVKCCLYMKSMIP
jgi:hypothetical protein